MPLAEQRMYAHPHALSRILCVLCRLVLRHGSVLSRQPLTGIANHGHKFQLAVSNRPANADGE